MFDNRRIDGSACVFGEADAPTFDQPFQPPFVETRFQAAPALEEKPGYPRDLERFEQLSLKARAALLGIETESIDNDRFPVIEAQEVVEAIAMACAFLESDKIDTTPFDRELFRDVAAARLGLAGGLQIVGCRIVANERASKPGIQLQNLQAPFSLRLIGCVIDCPILLSSAQLITLDLSGSAIRGLDATFLKAGGSIRFRRTFSNGPVDFSGARAHGYFDASDCFIRALGPVPTGQAYAVERGALNLSQAVVENELYLNRARVWGGLSMKGLITHRSVFMEDAILRSPVAVLERIAYQTLRIGIPRGLRVYEEIFRQEFHLADIKTWAWAKEEEKDKLIDLENVESTHRIFPKDSCLYQLLSQSMRARTSSLRADGLRVEGSFFARRIRCSGRVRLRYSHIQGGLHLDGAHLRSQEASAAVFDAFERCVEKSSSPWASKLRAFLCLRVVSSNAANLADAPQHDEAVLDISSARIVGRLALSRSLLLSRPRKGKEALSEPNKRAIIDGTVLARGCVVNDSVEFSDLACRWSRRSKTTPKSEDQIDLRNGRFGAYVNFRGSVGVSGINLDNAHIRGDLLFADKLAWPSGNADAPVPVQNGQTILECPNRAIRLEGTLNLRGTRVEGDAYLLFSPDEGPTLKAQLLKVGGRLDIMPRMSVDDEIKLARNASKIIGEFTKVPAETSRVTFNFADYTSANTTARDSLRELKEKARGTPSAWMKRIQPAHYINLKNAKATLFNHPPQAWPRQDGLTISGFRYDRSNDFGPLAPYPFPPKLVALRRKNWAPVCGILLSVGAFLISLKWLPIEAGASITWIACAVLLYQSVLGLLSWALPPTAGQSNPMAKRYLTLQQSARNRYRTPGHIYHPLDPYVVAAAALRDEGRLLSANLIEERRLKERTTMLSWRHDPMPKAALIMVRAVAGYGFRIQRALFIALYVILLSAAAIDNGMESGTLQYVNPPVTIRGGNAVPYKDPVHDWRSPKTCGSMRWQCEARNDLTAVTVSLDHFVPLLDLRARDKWEVRYDPAASQPQFWLALLLLFLRGFGGAFCTILLSSLAIRFETIFSRTAD